MNRYQLLSLYIGLLFMGACEARDDKVFMLHQAAQEGVPPSFDYKDFQSNISPTEKSGNPLPKWVLETKLANLVCNFREVEDIVSRHDEHHT